MVSTGTFRASSREQPLEPEDLAEAEPGVAREQHGQVSASVACPGRFHEPFVLGLLVELDHGHRELGSG
jgi:hypothetical protein